MCCALAVVTESAVAGAIEITPAMAKAGAELIWSYFYDAMVCGDESALEWQKRSFGP
jgi:hypothetical protein